MSFKFIPSTDTQTSAAAAATLADNDLDHGNVLWEQPDTAQLKIGNTGGSQATFDIDIQSTNTTLAADEDLSKDNDTYASTIQFVLEADEVSDIFFIRQTPREAAITGAGTIKVRVQES